MRPTVQWNYVTMCSSRKYPCPPQGRLTEIPSGRGVSESQFFEQKYDTKMEFPEGWGTGSILKAFCGRGIDIFWNNTVWQKKIHQISGWQKALNQCTKNVLWNIFLCNHSIFKVHFLFLYERLIDMIILKRKQSLTKILLLKKKQWFKFYQAVG